MSEPSATAAEERFTQPRGLARLWYAVLVGAAAWKLQLVVNYALVPYACWQRAEWMLHVASFVPMLLAATGGWVGWKIWKETGEGTDTALGGPEGRSRFMALSAMALSALFVLVILGQWIPDLLLGACDGIS
ncbi:MAG TPA: hypothetical protein VHG51_20735 [Longimicrobiaceae bacterium]|nr:hypothetical protein [Longimicrobiaceae bacterium]